MWRRRRRLTKVPSSFTTSHDSKISRKRCGSRALMTSPFQSWSMVKTGDAPGGFTGRVAAIEAFGADIFSECMCWKGEWINDLYRIGKTIHKLVRDSTTSIFRYDGLKESTYCSRRKKERARDILDDLTTQSRHFYTYEWMPIMISLRLSIQSSSRAPGE